jgi:polysaccharide export outer membrane protein
MDEARAVPGRQAQLVAVRAVFVAALLAINAAVSTAGCSGTNVNYRPPPPAVEDNSLGPGDVFAVRVFGEQELSQDYRVAQDGSIDFPYVGRIRVEGKEPTEVQDIIRRELLSREILRNPQVSVLVREVNSRRIRVFGQVQHPGSFTYRQGMTIVDAITEAGGFTAIADQGNTRLTRRIRGGRQRTYQVPVDQIAESRIGNVLLAPGDIVSVPERAF